MDKEETAKGEPFKKLPITVQEAINAHARYYADHHNLGMSIRDDLTYIAHLAIKCQLGAA